MNANFLAVVEADSIARAFGSRRAVDGVSLRVQSGETLALFGPNGAGKTTLLRLLGGLLKPSGGSARIGGEKVPGGAELRRQIGVISHRTLLYDALTARENVEFFARLYGVASPRDAAMRSLERMRISDSANRPVRALSRGMKQRVSIARATVHDPRVILADEPFTGLDASGARALSELLAELRASGAALILVTHNIDEGLSLATHASIMHRGKVIRHDACDSIDKTRYAAEYRDMVSNV
ncbi:MAG TPA: heme ABC exporter ATP-binding protein CcmA [Gemmatimonadaceae bacterium]|nr:heme ABC exporter ATP-binding protein CcmA [Gemmatimonadaceae bacterium]